MHRNIELRWLQYSLAIVVIIWWYNCFSYLPHIEVWPNNSLLVCPTGHPSSGQGPPCSQTKEVRVLWLCEEDPSHSRVAKYGQDSDGRDVQQEVNRHWEESFPWIYNIGGGYADEEGEVPDDEQLKWCDCQEWGRAGDNFRKDINKMRLITMSLHDVVVL